MGFIVKKATKIIKIKHMKNWDLYLSRDMKTTLALAFAGKNLPQDVSAKQMKYEERPNEDRGFQ